MGCIFDDKDDYDPEAVQARVDAYKQGKKPRYSFGDVKSTMKDGCEVSIGIDEPGDNVNIEFDYHDAHDGALYHVSAVGWRRRVK